MEVTPSKQGSGKLFGGQSASFSLHQCFMQQQELEEVSLVRVTPRPEIRLKPCLKKDTPCHRENGGQRQLRFSPQAEVRYYLSSPLVAENGITRLLSHAKGKLSVVKGSSPGERKIKLPMFLSLRFGRAGVYGTADN